MSITFVNYIFSFSVYLVNELWISFLRTKPNVSVGYLSVTIFAVFKSQLVAGNNHGIHFGHLILLSIWFQRLKKQGKPFNFLAFPLRCGLLRGSTCYRKRVEHAEKLKGSTRKMSAPDKRSLCVPEKQATGSEVPSVMLAQSHRHTKANEKQAENN